MSVPEYNPPPPSSGGSGWLVIVIVILLLILLGCAGLCGGCIVLTNRAAQQAGKALEELAENLPLIQPMVAAQMAVVNDPQVVDRLGEPVTLLTQPARQGAGKLNPAGETFQFDITGPKGKAIASAVATAGANSYRVVKITVTFEDGSLVEVPPPADDLDFGAPETGVEPVQPGDGGAIPLDPDLNAPIEAN